MTARAQSVFDAALATLALSIYPVPVKPGAKRPPMTEWQKLRLTADDLQEHFSNGSNIGWLLGIFPRPIADVDLDCPEALAVAPLIAGPKTQRISGHKSNPDSHYFFELPGECGSTKFQDPFRKKDEEKKMIVELRGKGLQTIVPPSVHVSGELYEWTKKGEFGITTCSDLLRWVSKIAAAAFLVRYWNPRVSARLALIGMLCRAGWPEEETLEFVSAVIRIADPNDSKDVKGNVANCYHRIAGDGEAFGQSTLKEVLGENGKTIIKIITEWLGLNRATPQGMILSENGNIKPILANAITALKHPKWEGVLALNEFSLQIVTRKETPWGKPAGEKWTDVDDIRAANWLQHQYVHVNPHVAHDAVQSIAEENRFHPVREYLKSLKWDGTSRLETWLISYLGAADTKFVRAVGKRWLISGVARIFRPGCQADHTLLLEGPQGIKKSTALRTLAGAEWFTDHISDLDSKDSRIELHGKWIVELAELSAVKRSLAIEKVKSFLTATSDHFRPPYGRGAIDVDRQNIFAGSVNDETPFTDETGNRRFWPVRCGTIDIEKLEADRDQLWAEAFERYENDEKWWLDSQELNDLAREEQQQRYQSGQWDEIIKRWAESPTQRSELRDGVRIYTTPWDGSNENEVTSNDVLLHAIGKPVDRWTHSDKIAVSKCLTANGWHRAVRKDELGKSQRVFRRGPS